MTERIKAVLDAVTGRIWQRRGIAARPDTPAREM